MPTVLNAMKRLPGFLLLAFAVFSAGCTTRTETVYVRDTSAPAPRVRPHSYGTASVTWVNQTPAAPVATYSAPATTERQPSMRQALRLLQKARATISSAARDKGGHRLKAIRQTDVAIAEVQAGIAFDRTH